jgi:hypothetical protein
MGAIAEASEEVYDRAVAVNTRAVFFLPHGRVGGVGYGASRSRRTKPREGVQRCRRSRRT